MKSVPFMIQILHTKVVFLSPSLQAAKIPGGVFPYKDPNEGLGSDDGTGSIF